MKKLRLIVAAVLLVCVIGVCLTACNEYKNCYGKTYSAHLGTAYEGDCSDALHSHQSIKIQKAFLGKAYVKRDVNGSSRKFKLQSAEEESMEFRGETITVFRMTFKAKWKTIDWKGGSFNNEDSFVVVYYPDGDYFIDGGCILRAS